MAPIYFPLLLNGLSYQPLGSLRFENYTKSVVRAADFQMNPLRRVQFSPSNHIILILELTPRAHIHTPHSIYGRNEHPLHSDFRSHAAHNGSIVYRLGLEPRRDTRL